MKSIDLMSIGSALAVMVSTTAVHDGIVNTAQAGAPGTTWSVPSDFKTIQAAIDASSDGDTIVVAAGEYSGPGNRDLHFGGRELLLRSEPVHRAILRIGGISRAMTIGAADDITVEGLTIDKGSALTGAGVLVEGASPTLRDCVFIFCQAIDDGGGVAAISGARPHLINCVFTRCESGRRGGGLFIDVSSGAIVDSCAFFSCRAAIQTSGGGGGVWISGAPEVGLDVTITGTRFEGNEALDAGGALRVMRPDTVRVDGCRFRDNESDTDGGAIASGFGGVILLTDCLLSGNRASGAGGGVRLSAGASGELDACTVTGNAAGGGGGGVSLEDGSVVAGRVALFGNGAGGLGADVHAETPGAVVSLDRSVADALGGGGDGAIDYGATLFDDPLFCDPKCFELAPTVDGEYTVDAGSPCTPTQNPWSVWIGSEPEGCPYAYDANNVELLSRIELSDLPCENQAGANDVWGYTSPTGREYAILGLWRGTAFVEVTIPTQPEVVAVIDDAESLWSDIATYQHYAYNVNEDQAVGEGVQIFDLSAIDDGIITELPSYTGASLRSAHNIAINEASGFAYLCTPNISGAGFAALDLSDPESPAFAGAWSPAPGAGRVHDALIVSYEEGPAAGREIAYAAGEGSGLYVIDVTNKQAMITIATVTYPNLTYTHQCWLSEDRNYLFVGDELDEPFVSLPTTTHIVDVADPANPKYRGSFTNGSTAIDHNLMVRGSFIFEANYTSGLRIFDYGDIDDVVEVAWFDTHPETEIPTYFTGAWGVYTGFDSDIVIVSDMQRGLYVFDPMHDDVPVDDPVDGEPPPATLPSAYALSQNRPNPLNGPTVIRVELPEEGPASLVVFDVSGRLVRSLVRSSALAPGRYDVRWDGRDASGRRVASGVYFYRLRAGSFEEKRSLVVLE